MKRLVLIAALVLAPAAHAGSGPRQGVVTLGDGKALYAANCSSCHGSVGEGTSRKGPSLRDAGARAADFYLRTGYMPLGDPGEQPTRTRVLFTDAEIRSIVAYVASLGNGPPIPAPQPQQGSVASGQKLFVDHCAGCHQIAGKGGYVTGARVPPLSQATNRQIAEALRIGPYLMPRFPKSQLSDAQVNSLIAYIDYTKHPDDAGGWSLGHLGPWPEGLVAWLLAGTALVGLCIVIGRRLPS
jgi:ubiquinol-cytochrome c reductase cytochrome c subunit